MTISPASLPVAPSPMSVLVMTIGVDSLLLEATFRVGEEVKEEEEEAAFPVGRKVALSMTIGVISS